MLRALLLGFAAFYLASCIAYGVVGTSLTPTANPHYRLTTHIANYTTDVNYNQLSFSQDTVTSDYYITTHNLLLTIGLGLIYAIGYGSLKMNASSSSKTDSSDNASPADYERVMYVLSRTFFFGSVIAWWMIQADLMYLLGNKDLTASWMATGNIVAQLGLYFVMEQTNLMYVLKKADRVRDRTMATLIVDAFAGLVGIYLFVMVVGVGILTPIANARATAAITELPTHVVTVVSLYVTTQIVELARFGFILIGHNAGKDSGFDWAAKMASHEIAIIFVNLWLAVLAGVYIFTPMEAFKAQGLL